MPQKPKRLIVIGAGFAGLNLVKELAHEEIDILLIDRSNHHLFQPLLYQVASAALSPADIAMPIRAIFKNQKNVKVIMAEVKKINKKQNSIELVDGSTFDFDFLAVASGARHSYFGNDSWEEFAPGLKSIADALKIRQNILRAYEHAEMLSAENLLPPEELKSTVEKLLTFVIVGAGPTGVELAGAIGEIAHKTLRYEFRNIDPHSTRVVLVEAFERILPPYPAELSARAEKSLKKLGVEVLTSSMVKKIRPNEILINDQKVAAGNIFWAAGNAASPLLQTIGCELDKAGRAIVNSYLQLPENENIFILGDCANLTTKDKKVLPAVAGVAIQQGKFTAKNISYSLKDQKLRPFEFHDRGTMATIGRASAVAQIGKLKFHGLTAWLLWSVVHVMYLIGFRNRVAVMSNWVWSYLTDKRSVRLITYQ